MEVYMHIPDGLLNIPTVAAAGAMSIGSISMAIKKTKETLEDKQVPTLGIMAAFIFAAQMINFPVAIGTSGHMIGAFFSAIILGPWATIIIMSSILIIQSLFFGDGGVLALGANIFNMAVIANFSGYYIYRLFKKNDNHYSSYGVIVGGLVSVVATAIIVGIEIVLSGRGELLGIIKPLVFWHILIGFGEGLITLFLVSYISKVRKELLSNTAVGGSK